MLQNDVQRITSIRHINLVQPLTQTKILNTARHHPLAPRMKIETRFTTIAILQSEHIANPKPAYLQDKSKMTK